MLGHSTLVEVLRNGNEGTILADICQMLSNLLITIQLCCSRTKLLLDYSQIFPRRICSYSYNTPPLPNVINFLSTIS